MFRQWLVGCLPEEEFTPWAWQMLAKKRQAVLHALATLRGKNLACWCAEPEPGQPDMCHAAVLLELANR
jgi:hypothetical protein